METIKELKEICQPHRKQNQRSKDWGYLKHRELSIYITRIILRLAGRGIKPNHISLFNILFGIAILLLIIFNEDKFLFLLFLLLFYFSFLLDKVDGEVARYQKVITLRGAYLDEVYHLFVQNGLILAVGISRFLITGEDVFLLLGLSGFLLFLLVRYNNKLRYFIYAKYKSKKDKFLIKKNLSKTEKTINAFLNIFPLRLCSIARRHDVFLFLIFLLSIFYFDLITAWFWFLIIWAAMLAINVLRFLIVNYFSIDQDVKLVDENKL